MPYDGNGNFNRVHNWVADATNGLDINAVEMDAEDNGFAAGLSNAVTRDGQGKMTVDFLPSVDNTLNLGSGAFRWASINGTPISNFVSATQAAIGALLYPRTAAEIAAGVTPTNYAYPEGYLYRYGTNTTPGTTDMTAAINAAFSLANRDVILPGDTILITSNPNVPACRAILGQGENASIIQCGNAVTKALSLSSVCNKLADFQILGNATASAIGIVFGDTTSGAYDVQRVRVKSFTGTNAIGFKFSQALKSSFIKLTADTCTIGFLYDGTGTAGFPTTCTYIGCAATNCSSNGWKFIVGYGAVLIDCVSESSGVEGMLLAPTTSNALQDITLYRCWLEANNSGTGYQLKVDGTAAGALVRAAIRDTYFVIPNSLKAIQMTGAGCAGFLIDNPQISRQNAAGAIQIDTSAYGQIVNWQANNAYGTVVTDTARTGSTPNLGAEAIAGPYIDFSSIVLLTSDIGNQAATFNGAPTISVARFKLEGKKLFLELAWSGTLNAVTPNYIKFSLPTGLNTQNTNTYTPAHVKNASTYESSLARWGGTDIWFYRNAFANYGSAAAIAGYFTGEVEIQ